MLATEHLVRGYDGQLTPAAGVIEAPVALSLLDGAASGAPQRLLVAQLHSDDVILGLPWLASTGAIVDFAARSVSLDHGDGRRTISLAVVPLPAQSSSSAQACSAQIMEAIVALYSAELDGSHHIGSSDLAAAMRDVDDRGSARPRAKAPSPEDAALDALRKRVLVEHADVFPDKLPPGLPPGRGHELRIQLQPGSQPPHRQPPRRNQKHAAFEAKWIKDMLANGHIKHSQSEYAAPHFYVDKGDSACKPFGRRSANCNCLAC